MPNKLTTNSINIPTTSLPTPQTPTITQQGDRNIVVQNAQNLTILNARNPTVMPDLSRTLSSLSNEYYNLIVSDSIDLNEPKSSFSISPSLALTKYIDTDIKRKFAPLSEDAKNELLRFPSIFMHENTSYGSPSPSQNFALGRIININVSPENIIFTVQLWPIDAQQILNENRRLFGICGHECINELDECHWSIKKINLLSALRESGISI